MSKVIIATDNFNRADSATLGANWTTCNGDDGSPHELKIVSNQITPTSGPVDNISRRTAEIFDLNHYSQITLTNISSDTHMGVTVRSSLDNCYMGQLRNISSVLRITKKTGVTYTTLTENTVTVANGDIIRLEVFSKKLSIYYNNVLINSVFDGSFTTGVPGIVADQTTDTLDDWEGGNIYIPNIRYSNVNGGRNGRPRPFAPGIAR